MITRRTFVGLMGCVVASGSLGLGLSRRRNIPLTKMSSDKLKPLENSIVCLHGNDGHRFNAMVESIQVESRHGRYGAPNTESISVYLKSEANDAPSGTYRLQGDEVELEEMLFTAVGREGNERRLQAVINRIV
jgi:hypothetical protein